MKKRYLFLAVLIGLFFASCEKEILPPTSNPTPISNSRYLLVGNEGALGTNTASLSRIDLTNNTITNNIYENKNGQGLGDVFQSMQRVGDRYYFMVNNSNKIIVTDTNFNKVTEINNILGPRYMQAISATQAYVTSLFNNKIYIIDLITNTKVSEIAMAKNWTEQMVLVGDATGDYIFVCENDTSINYITKINVATHQIVGRITVGGASPSGIGITSDNHLWILAGNDALGKISTLTEIELGGNTIVKFFTFDAQYETGKLGIGPNDEKYVTVVNRTTNKYGIYKFKKGATAVPANFFVDTPPGANFYGVAVDPTNGDVYISDTKGFTQAGDVNRYSSTGNFLSSWTAAIGPSSFYFVQ